MNNTYATAYKLLRLGYSVIPSGGGDKHKAPLANWLAYQTTTPDENQLEVWERELHPVLWGIVTNNCIAVIDADTPETRAQLEAELGEPHVVTPRGGAHWYIDTTGHPLKTTAGLLPGVDVRGIGGFVNVTGTRLAYVDKEVDYPTTDYIMKKLPVLDELIPWSRLPKRILAALNGSKPAQTDPILEGQPIPEGQRNHTLTSFAGTMRRRGMPQEAIEAALLEVNRTQCQPSLPENEVKAIARSVARYSPNGNNRNIYNNTNVTGLNAHERYETVTETVTGERKTDTENCNVLSERILEWVKNTTGWWETAELDKDLSITSQKQKNNRRIIIYRLKEQGIIEPHQRINKQFRYVNTKVTSLAFKTASNVGVLPIKWPLSIEKKVNLFPGNMAVVAGSPNAGKTALLLRFIYLNQDQFPIFYFCSEMGAVELRDRLDKFPGMDIDDWKFEAIERAGDFADVIRPDCINVIDYLEMTTDLYAVNTYLTAIIHKLGTGLALVAIQKKQGAAFGRGQEFGMEKPKLYLSMDKGKLQIIKGKSWATKNVDPHGLKVNFKIIGGCEFEVTNEWYQE